MWSWLCCILPLRGLCGTTAEIQHLFIHRIRPYKSKSLPFSQFTSNTSNADFILLYRRLVKLDHAVHRRRQKTPLIKRQYYSYFGVWTITSRPESLSYKLPQKDELHFYCSLTKVVIKAIYWFCRGYKSITSTPSFLPLAPPNQLIPCTCTPPRQPNYTHLSPCSPPSVPKPQSLTHWLPEGSPLYARLFPPFSL